MPDTLRRRGEGLWLVMVAVALIVIAGPAFGHSCTQTAWQPDLHGNGSEIAAHGHTDCTGENGNDRHEVRLYRVISLLPDDLWGSAVDTPGGGHGFGRYTGWVETCEDPNANNVMQTWVKFTGNHTLTAKNNSEGPMSCS